jgi:hypothetical protein
MNTVIFKKKRQTKFHIEMVKEKFITLYHLNEKELPSEQTPCAQKVLLANKLHIMYIYY